MNTSVGVVRYWNAEKQFGFVREYGARTNVDDIVFHADTVQGIPEAALNGARVVVEWMPSSRGPRAVHVRREDGA